MADEIDFEMTETPEKSESKIFEESKKSVDEQIEVEEAKKEKHKKVKEEHQEVRDEKIQTQDSNAHSIFATIGTLAWNFIATRRGYAPVSDKEYEVLDENTLPLEQQLGIDAKKYGNALTAGMTWISIFGIKVAMKRGQANHDKVGDENNSGSQDTQPHGQKTGSGEQSNMQGAGN